MIVDPTDEQKFFRETTARFLAERAPVVVLRKLRDDPLGFEPQYWRAGANLRMDVAPGASLGRRELDGRWRS